MQKEVREAFRVHFKWSVLQYAQVTCPPNIGPGDMLEFGLDERRRNGQETLHSRTDHRHASGG